ncbi:DJ-1/PfpI/YhbO family deglycase/protease [Planococcaceae bacterium Storch 2/2-2]|nr:DJ-1/PfpI/YhbO family deglycase/protease [Planococcaceae bacterium Storch 2/2-2]
MAKIAAVLAHDFEDSEFFSPKKAFEGAGHTVEVIGEEKEQVIKGKQGEVVTSTIGIDDANPTDYDAFFIPGGYSPDNLRADDRFVQFAKAMMDAKKPTFAICHGPQLLITAKTLDGRDSTGYKSIWVDLENAGATLHDEPVFVCQNQLVTSRTPDDLPDFEREALRLLES